MKESEYVSLRFEGTSAILTLNHPPANTLSAGMSRAIEVAAVAADSDPSTRAIVIASAMPSIFMAGGDIRGMRQMIENKDTAAFGEFIDASQSAFRRLSALSVPVIAAIDGHAMGGGGELALSCDLRFMAQGKWQFGLTEARHGIFPAAGGTQLLTRMLGPSRAFELLMKGISIDAKAAAALGLVDHVITEGTALDAALAWAADLSNAPKQAIAGIKRCVFGGLGVGLDQGYQIERREILRVIMTSDAWEGLNAFIEKRKPVFQGK